MSGRRSLAELTAEDFRAAQGSPVQVTATVASPAEGAEASSFKGQLVEVTEHPGGAPGPFRTPFSVVFEGPMEPVMAQGTYRVQSDRLGELELFLVPVGPRLPAQPGQPPTAMQYEAVFA